MKRAENMSGKERERGKEREKEGKERKGENETDMDGDDPPPTPANQSLTTAYTINPAPGAPDFCFHCSSTLMSKCWSFFLLTTQWRDLSGVGGVQPEDVG